jgi:hypothetical protein
VDRRSLFVKKPHIYIIIAFASVALLGGCKEADTLKREIGAKIKSMLRMKDKTVRFVPKDGITIRQTSLYQAANLNSEVLRKLPAEESLYLMDKIGEFYRGRARDGLEGFVQTTMIGGEDMIEKMKELRRSIESIPVQAEGVTKTRAYFRLEPGRQYDVLEALPAGKKFELYERVVTPRQSNPQSVRGRSQPDEPPQQEDIGEVKKDVWYKVKIEDGRAGYIHTLNMQVTPPEDLAKAYPSKRIMAWRPVNTTDDPDQGAKTNFIAALSPRDKHPGCDFTQLIFWPWSTKLKKRKEVWMLSVNGVLPITTYHAEGKQGFSIRQLHPTKKDKLILASYLFLKGTIKKVQEEEIPNTAQMH